MEMYVDAYDWVMVPNVYGMTQYAEYFDIKHESPQIIFYDKNEVQFTDSHMNIDSSKVLDYL